MRKVRKFSLISLSFSKFSTGKTMKITAFSKVIFWVQMKMSNAPKWQDDMEEATVNDQQRCSSWFNSNLMQRWNFHLNRYGIKKLNKVEDAADGLSYRVIEKWIENNATGNSIQIKIRMKFIVFAHLIVMYFTTYSNDRFRKWLQTSECPTIITCFVCLWSQHLSV